jgi:hypothetical protein
MNKKIIFSILFIVFSIIPILSLELSVSPGNLEFNGKINEKLCNEFLLQSDYNKTIITDLKWNNNPDTRSNINDYTISSNQLNINEDFDKNLKINKVSLKKQICLTFNEPGEYNGALIFKTQDSIAGVGIWIKAKITGKKTNTPNTNDNFQKITGLSIINPIENKNNIYLISLVITIILITILITLMFAKKIK